VQPAWGIEDPRDLHLEPRQSSNKNLVGYTIFYWDPNSPSVHKEEYNGRSRSGKVQVHNHRHKARRLSKNESNTSASGAAECNSTQQAAVFLFRLLQRPEHCYFVVISRWEDSSLLNVRA